MTPFELTPNLCLNYIEENNCKENKLIAVCCIFSFYGKEGVGYVLIEKLNPDYPNFAMIEFDSELFDSFVDQIEQHWKTIVKQIEEYHDKWKSIYNE